MNVYIISLLMSQIRLFNNIDLMIFLDIIHVSIFKM